MVLKTSSSSRSQVRQARELQQRLNEALRTNLAHEGLVSGTEARQAEQRELLQQAHEAELGRMRAQLAAAERRAEQGAAGATEERASRDAELETARELQVMASQLPRDDVVVTASRWRRRASCRWSCRRARAG